MTVNSRAKGARYERDVELHLDRWLGDRVTRTNRSGYDGDDFDIDGHLSIEAKNQARLNLAGWMTQALEQAGDDRVGLVVFKRTGTTDVGQHYVLTTVDELMSMLVLYGRPETTP